MVAGIVDVVYAAMSSPWVYLAVFVFVAVDAFFPTIPGETLVVASGAFAASGHPNLLAIVAVSAAAGFAGDHVSYQLGRGAGSRLVRRLEPGSRRRRPFDWAARVLHERGGEVLVVCRFVPGCRTAATLTTGSVDYPRGPFAAFTALGALCWATWFTMAGYLGGLAFRDSPGLAVLLGIAVAVVLACCVEGLRRARARRARRTVTTGQ